MGEVGREAEKVVRALKGFAVGREFPRALLGGGGLFSDLYRIADKCVGRFIGDAM